MIVASGASGGIGRAALPLLTAADRVIGLYNRKRPDAPADSRIEYSQLDLSSEAAINAFVERSKATLERITLVHFAAKSQDHLAVHFPEGDWDQVMGVNLKGDFLLSKALVPLMIKQSWGRIIHISSVVGMNGAPGTIAYAASKTGLIGLSRVLAKEYARFGITSNVLCLGYFDAGLIETLTDQAREKIRAQIPSRRFGNVAEVAKAIRWLIDSDYVNGAVVNIDGGI